MKMYLKTFASLLLTACLISSCSKDENKIYYEGGSAPVLTASSTLAMTLTISNAANPAVTFKWTNPDYRFTTGTSSQDVTYLLQVDTTGANFTNPAIQEISISKDLSKTFTVTELNTVLAKLNVAEDKPHNIEFRVKSTLSNGSVALVSNVVKMVVTPYLDVAVPIPTNNTLWLTGNATSSGYQNPLLPPYDATQKFTRISNTLYELTLAMPGGGGYKLIQIQNDWSTQYHMITGGTWDAGDFEKKDADPGFPGPPTAGNYKITFNFKTGKYTVVKL